MDVRNKSHAAPWSSKYIIIHNSLKRASDIGDSSPCGKPSEGLLDFTSPFREANVSMYLGGN